MTSTHRNSLHICYVESGYPHPHGGGGAGSYVQLVGRELIRRGHQVSVMAAHCPQCGERQEDDGVQVYRPQVRGPLHWYLGRLPGVRQFALAVRTLEWGWRIASRINRLHRRQPVDLIEFSDGGDVWHTLRHTIPYVVHLHGSRYTFLRMSRRPVTRGDWLERQLGLWCIRRADQVISPSWAMLDEVQREAKASFDNAVVMPYPVDPRLLTTAMPTPAGTNHRTPRIFFAARNDPVKGGDILLQAIPLVRLHFPEVEFRFFGYQPQSDQAAMPGVSFKPFLPKEQLIHEYAQADICIVPSFWDNSPNTVYEAMAAAKPVIASRVGGIPELVKDSKTGLLVEPGNPQQLAQAILYLLDHSETGLKMGSNGRLAIGSRSVDLVVDKLERVYKNTVKATTSDIKALRVSSK